MSRMCALRTASKHKRQVGLYSKIQTSMELLSVPEQHGHWPCFVDIQKPYTELLLDEVRSLQITDRLILITLHPQGSISTLLHSCRHIRSLSRSRWPPLSKFDLVCNGDPMQGYRCCNSCFCFTFLRRVGLIILACTVCGYCSGGSPHWIAGRVGSARLRCHR
jgi:hypothetical protein